MAEKQKSFWKALGRWWKKFAALVLSALIVSILVMIAIRAANRGDSITCGFAGGLAGFFIRGTGGGFWQAALAAVGAGK